MPFSKSKSTKRFEFNIHRDTKSHKAGANRVSIVTSPPADYESGNYYTSRSQITMTVKEAKAFQSFLNTHLTTGDSKVTD
jgi:hypothetical protein